MRSPHVKKVLRLLVPHVASDARALRLFANAINETSQTKFITCIWSVIDENWSGAPYELCRVKWFRDFVNHCASQICVIPDSLATAFSLRKARYNSARNVKKRFGQSLGFTKRARQSKSVDFANIPETVVTTYSKSEAYPPLKHWMYETEAIKKKWKNHLTSGRRPDTRKPYLPMVKVDTSLIDHDVAPSESRRFRDSSSNFVCGVYRNFCPNEGVLPVADGIVQEAVSNRKNVRMEDPGSLVQIGFSAGARSAPKFDWVRNITNRKLPSDIVDDMDHRSSSAFALFWNLCRNCLPDEVMGDFDKFFEDCCMPRMDPCKGAAADSAGDGNQQAFGDYSIQIGDDKFVFRNAERAPPAGVCGQNYSRSTHFEHQPHKFAISWTVRRDHPPSAGGHFYISTYRIRVQAAANTLVVWRPADIHGTSLQNLRPADPNPAFLQTGIAIVTSNRLPAVWKKYRDGVLSHQDAVRILLESDDELDEHLEHFQAEKDKPR